MNLNEECLIQFLNNPGRLELTTNELKKFIFSLNSNIILKEETGKKINSAWSKPVSPKANNSNYAGTTNLNFWSEKTYGSENPLHSSH